MKSPRTRKKPGLALPVEAADASPFNLWLHRGLHELYDKVAGEPVPDELLKLIEDDRNDPKP